VYDFLFFRTLFAPTLLCPAYAHITLFLSLSLSLSLCLSLSLAGVLLDGVYFFYLIFMFICSTAPNVPHYKKNKAVGIMRPGHTFTVEPMINLGIYICIYIYIVYMYACIYMYVHMNAYIIYNIHSVCVCIYIFV
jgi:hypothetical protein